MTTQADILVDDGVAHIALNAGRAARLSQSIIRQIDTALATVRADDTVDIVVLSGKSGFPSGLTEPQAGGDDPDNTLSRLCRTIETFPKPVVTVLTGSVIGGGAELALACHYRIAQSETRIGFPHVRLGLIPHAGATQRLPRLVGAEATLELLLGGHILPMTSPMLTGLLDHVFDTNPFEAVIAFTQALRAKGATPRPTEEIRSGFANAQGFLAALAKAKTKFEASHVSAVSHILFAVEAALVLPMDAGLAFEDAAFEDCCEAPDAHALTHLFHAENSAAARARRSDLPQITTLAVLGGGPFASQIVVAALDAGLHVNWAIKDAAQQRDSVGRVRAMLQDGVTKGRITAAQAEQYSNALRLGDAAEMTGDADLALRAAQGQRNLHLPPELLVAHCLPGTDPRLSLRLGPAQMHPRLAEIVLGPESRNTDVQTVLALARRLTLLPIVQRSADDCLSDRLRRAQWRAADALVDLGQSPYAIDAALRDWGMETPPYRAADLAGLGTVARQERHASGSNWSGVLMQQGRMTVDGSGGFYLALDDGHVVEDKAVPGLLDALRTPQPALHKSAITRLMLGALANEAVRAVLDGSVDRASDVDVVSVLAGLVPRWRGGLLHAAHAGGLLQITRAMTDLGHPDTDFWTPHPVFADLIKNGVGFDSLQSTASR